MINSVHTYEETAEALGMSPYQVRDLEQRALRKLRANPEITKIAGAFRRFSNKSSPFFEVQNTSQKVEEA